MGNRVDSRMRGGLRPAAHHPSAGSSLARPDGDVNGVHDGSGMTHGEHQSCVVLVDEFNHDGFAWSADVWLERARR